MSATQTVPSPAMSVTPAPAPAATRDGTEAPVNPFVQRAPFRLRRSVGTAYRRGTQSRRALPGILVLGAIKAGTSSLFRWLVQHPQVAPPATGKKELRFFDTNYQRGVGWYRAQFPLAAKLAEGGYRGIERGARCIDATPNYLFHPLAPERAARVVPEARMLVLLRNPVDRALSHYAMNVRIGLEDLPLGEALAAEADRIAPSLEHIRAGGTSKELLPYELFSYVSRGFYAEQLRRWYDVFPREQLLVLRSEDLFADPPAVGAQIVAFFGLDPWSGAPFPTRNADIEPEVTPDLRRSLEARFAEPNEDLAELVSIRW